MRIQTELKEKRNIKENIKEKKYKERSKTKLGKSGSDD